MGIAEEIPTHVGEQKCFNFIKEKVAQWMNVAEMGTFPCFRRVSSGSKPTTEVVFSLWCQKDIRAKYIAISYC
jgi:hypothetical protein